MAAASSMGAGVNISGVPLYRPPTKPTETQPTPTGSTSSGGSSTPSTKPFTCSADVGSGAFKNPIQVSLSCTNTASVRYCLAEGACCDPETGATYTAAIPVGQSPKSYCLSFVGEMEDGTLSSVVQKNYAFNPGLPHLMVTQPQTTYQTTELNAKSMVASDDFGKDDFTMGVINLFNHEPVASGLTTCEEIVTDHSSIVATPLPLFAIPEVATGSYTPSSQLTLSVGKSKLQYGDNWLTTFLKNASFDEMFYACSTTKVVLEDFLYFQAGASFGGPGSNQIREFEGGFTELGYFEAEPTLYRGPASGQATEVVSNQRLKSGLFSIFY